jgi:4-alpha-glucanotransferase
VDHVVGLFRIWSIPYNEPLDNQGLNGVFDPAEDSKWSGQGRKILNVMREAASMQLCAEDLGIIPNACPEALKELNIPGNDVQRWVKDWNNRHDFLPPNEYRELSVAMLSTHDTTNWPAWWDYEAGTVDEALFIRKCSDNRNIGFDNVKDKLFDPARSKHGRLRWREDVDSVDKLLAFLGKSREESGDFIDLYLNTFQEKEKLWVKLGLSGAMREKCDKDIMRKAMKLTLDSSAVFCVNTIFDYLYLADILKGDPYQYRINTPGTISEKNWSLTIPLSLEELIEHKVTKEIRKLVESCGRK